MFVFFQALMAGPNTHDGTSIHLQGLTGRRGVGLGTAWSQSYVDTVSDTGYQIVMVK